MKILYISPVKITSHKGESTHFLEVGRDLEKIGHKLLIICRGKRVNFRELNIKNIPDIEIKYFTTIILDLFFTICLSCYLLRFKPDVIYYRGVIFAGVFSRIFKIPSTAEANGIYPDEVKAERPSFFRIFGSILQLRERMIYLSAKRIICVTEGIKRELIKNYGIENDRCKVISNGVNTNLFRPLDKIACRKKIRFDEDYFYAGFVGSFRSWQGLDTLIKAIKIVKKQGYEKIRFILVGNGDQLKDLKEMVKAYGLQNETIFIGGVKYEEVPILINCFDVCLAPFKKDRNIKIGLSPLKLYEYLACGRPVIASRVEGVKDVVEDGNCGYLFEPDDVEGLGAKIIESYSQRNKLSEFGNNGRALMVASFSWEKIVMRVESVLKEAVSVISRH
jgi:glycosyltransferase involved in cell wall biosynthesis